jgi:hypothetical protein
MSSSPTSQHEEIDRVFSRTLPLLESALIQEYRLTPQEAADLEQSLLDWFRGFARRPGSPNSYESLRRHLLSMACQAGHVFSSGRSGVIAMRDERLQRALALGPQQIAIEIEENAPVKTTDEIGDDTGRTSL